MTAANISDVHLGRIFVTQLKNQPRLQKILVDKGYQRIEGKHGEFSVEITSKKPDQKGFVPLHKRWVIERKNAWNTRQRRLAKDYEFRSDHQESMIFVGIIGIMLRRLA